MNTLNNLDVILGFQLVMGLPEIIICELGALILGFTIHFFWNSKKSLRISDPSVSTGISENDNWKLKYYNDMDMQERAQQQLRDRLSQAQESEQILTIELEETRRELEEVQKELENTRLDLQDAGYKLTASATLSVPEGEPSPAFSAPLQAEPASDYLSQLKAAQEKLVEHNNSIYRLLEHTQLLGEAEKKNQRLARILADTEEKLKESNFQRQQFQKRSVFLEELNHDLQEISEHNKKIESQLRRVSDMETLLAKITGSANEDMHNG